MLQLKLWLHVQLLHAILAAEAYRGLKYIIAHATIALGIALPILMTSYVNHTEREKLAHDFDELH